MNKDLNYYEMLGLNFDFTPKDLKTNYRTLSKKYHPDMNDGDDSQFIVINEAYKVFSDDEKRENYDKESKWGKNYDPFLELLEFEFSNNNLTSTSVEVRMGEYKKQEMLHIVLELPKFMKQVKYERNIICSKCDGSGNTNAFNLNLRGNYRGDDLGTLFKDEEIQCDICGGTGTFNKRECPGCHGEGYISLGLSQCDKCSGVGILEVSKKIQLNKKNFTEGKLKLEFYGNQSKYNGKTGNLYIIIKD